MGFFVMLGSGLLGLFLLVLGCMRVKNNALWIASILVGISCIGLAVWLAWPK